MGIRVPLEREIDMELHLKVLSTAHCHLSTTRHFTFYSCIVPLGFLPWEIRVASPRGKPAATVALPNLRCMLGV